MSFDDLTELETFPFGELNGEKWKNALQQQVGLKRERRCGGEVRRSDLRGQQLSIGEFLEIIQMVDRGRRKVGGSSSTLFLTYFDF